MLSVSSSTTELSQGIAYFFSDFGGGIWGDVSSIVLIVVVGMLGILFLIRLMK